MKNTMEAATQTHTADMPIFERARQAIRTLSTLRDQLSPAERETLAILLDKDAMNTVAESQKQAQNGQFEPLEDAIARTQ